MRRRCQLLHLSTRRPCLDLVQTCLVPKPTNTGHRGILCQYSWQSLRCLAFCTASFLSYKGHILQYSLVTFEICPLNCQPRNLEQINRSCLRAIFRALPAFCACHSDSAVCLADPIGCLQPLRPGEWCRSFAFVQSLQLLRLPSCRGQAVRDHQAREAKYREASAGSKAGCVTRRSHSNAARSVATGTRRWPKKTTRIQYA